MSDFNRRSSRTSMRSKPLGQLLVENGDVTNEHVAQAVKAQGDQGGMLGGILQRMGACGPDAIGHALSKQVQVTDVHCEELDGTGAPAKLISRDICNREKLCPFEILGNLLCVVMGNPLNRKAITEIEGTTRMKVKAFKAPWPKITELIERSYSTVNAPAAAGKTQTAPKSMEPLEDLSFDLDDAPSAPAVNSSPVSAGKSRSTMPTATAPAVTQKPVPQRDALSLDDDDIIIPASEPEFDSAGATGILEVPDDTIPLPSSADIPNPFYKPNQAPVQPTIKGFDSLDFTGGEVVDVVKRKFGTVKQAKKPEPKIAKVNVDLEQFDQSSAEMIDTYQRPENDAMEEIQHGDADTSDARSSAGVLVALKIVPDSYFYAGNAPKNAPRSDDLMDIIEALPVAQVVAESIVDFELHQADGGSMSSPMESGSLISMSGAAMAGKGRVDLQRAPATPMAAIRLGEGEFQRLTLTLVEDDGGEWEWNFASTGPVAVDVFED